MGFSIGNAALRLVTGAYILNSGVGKLGMDHEHSSGLQDMASQVIPQVAQIDSDQFGKYLGYGEIVLGSALLAPFIPSRLAGLGLGVFSAGLIFTYLKTPGMTRSDGIRPSADGTAMAKDFWLAGVSAALIFHRKRKGPKPLG
ncbi:DoxX family membrane protein [Paeniglutamicibacter cryotolerans]|uniref:Putative membrane protein YphA (DoxX/SURF4 family) n=1 Tax=Paeniglutamicibacter cryotolerans TaxID=670079 RepID=A0A839QGD7_9MICC|nr:DoxX family membrane protein [Paeniglutamicibacter cryotolerans]MBB2995388.1 putative membrane protein YphA (DoxX/SURF4 family) [Paeniglutamicibacter cryotolerans]